MTLRLSFAIICVISLYVSLSQGQWAIGQYHTHLNCSGDTILSIYSRLGCVKAINALKPEIQLRECNGTHYTWKKCFDSECTQCEEDEIYDIKLNDCYSSSVWTCGTTTF